MTESEIIMLTNYIQMAPQWHAHVPGRGDPQPVDEYRVILSKAQRDAVVNALRRLPADDKR